MKTEFNPRSVWLQKFLTGLLVRVTQLPDAYSKALTFLPASISGMVSSLLWSSPVTHSYYATNGEESTFQVCSVPKYQSDGFNTIIKRYEVVT